jgi:hypothetical protein
MSRPNHSLLVAGLAALAVTATSAAVELVAPAAEAARAASAQLLSCTGGKLTRPLGTVVLACGDGNIEISKTDWSSWTGSGASGTTTLDINLCNPTCAQSKMRSFPGSAVRLFDVLHSSSGPVFARAAITYRHAGKQATVTAYPRT